MNRRQLLTASLLGPLLLRASGALATFAPGTTKSGIETLRQQWKKLLAPHADIAADATPITLTDEQWEKRLDPLAYRVLRHGGTEHPGSSPLNTELREGVFACAGCALPVFTSAMKFDSGTGWPSFWKPLPNAVRTTSDKSMLETRTEVHCRRCGGHLGHVFDDGPPPTHLRYCMDGIALKFVPA